MDYLCCWNLNDFWGWYSDDENGLLMNFECLDFFYFGQLYPIRMDSGIFRIIRTGFNHFWRNLDALNRLEAWTFWMPSFWVVVPIRMQVLGFLSITFSIYAVWIRLWSLILNSCCKEFEFAHLNVQLFLNLNDLLILDYVLYVFGTQLKEFWALLLLYFWYFRILPSCSPVFMHFLLSKKNV